MLMMRWELYCAVSLCYGNTEYWRLYPLDWVFLVLPSCQQWGVGGGAGYMYMVNAILIDVPSWVHSSQPDLHTEKQGYNHYNYFFTGLSNQRKIIYNNNHYIHEDGRSLLQASGRIFGNSHLCTNVGDIVRVEPVASIHVSQQGETQSQTLASSFPHDGPGTPSPLQLDLLLQWRPRKAVWWATGKAGSRECLAATGLHLERDKWCKPVQTLSL